jgi:ATP-binding cassette subfamily B multidrug efflux pump
VLATLLAIFRYLLRMLTGHIAAGITYRMNQDLFDRVLVFDQATLQSYGIGDLLSRSSNDFIYIWRFYSAGFQMSMHALFLLAIGTTLMTLSSPMLAMLVVALLFISLGVQMVLGRVLERSLRSCATTDSAHVGICAGTCECYAYAGGVHAGRRNDRSVSTRE